jgi:hypothetical protein
MAIIQLPDSQAEALASYAAEQGLTLEGWLGRLASTGTTPLRGSRTGRVRYSLDELVAQCASGPDVAHSEEDRLWLEASHLGREVI